MIDLNIRELCETLRSINSDKRCRLALMPEMVDLCFDIMHAYCQLPPAKRRDKDNWIGCCYAAVIVSRVVQASLGERVRLFATRYKAVLGEQIAGVLMAPRHRLFRNVCS